MVKTETSDDIDLEVMTSVGHALSKRRQDLGYDISFVASKLKLRVSQLEALETDNRNFFPGRPYYLGFLKSYAEFLGMDFKTLPLLEPVEKKESVLRSASPGESRAHLPELRPLPGNSKRSIPFGIFLMVGVGLTVMAYLGWYQVTRPPHQIPISDQATEESLETTIPPIAVEKKDEREKESLSTDLAPPVLPPDKGMKILSEKKTSESQNISEATLQNERQITLIALKEETPVEIIDKQGKSVFSDSLEKNREWVSPHKDGKYFISVNDASAIGIKTKSGKYHALGKRGEMLRNFDLSRLNGN
ncbi:hypothetical protein FAI41_00405 [Acetobacteraceae bacterium]|nr:hypothetical protein FAI41_00405 [Acetobacteraceae bacterium]